jgi:hypothetical protein
VPVTAPDQVVLAGRVEGGAAVRYRQLLEQIQRASDTGIRQDAGG